MSVISVRLSKVSETTAENNGAGTQVTFEVAVFMSEIEGLASAALHILGSLNMVEVNCHYSRI